MLVVHRKHASGPNAIEVTGPVRHSKRQATRSTGSIAIDSDERISIDNDPRPRFAPGSPRFAPVPPGSPVSRTTSPFDSTAA